VITGLVSGTANEPEINAAVRIAFTFASQRLRQLLRSKRLHLQSFSISTDGLAFDCIAELFQRDGENRFIELIDYFSGDRDIQSLDDAETTQQFRILIFSKVNQGLFRLYKENDPVLAKLLRNVKLAVKADESMRRFDMLGQIFVHTCLEEERNDHLPEFPLEEMERELTSRIDARRGIPSNISALFDILNDQDRYRRFYSIIDIAVVLKRAMARLEVVENQTLNAEHALLQSEINQEISKSLALIRARLHGKYVLTNKLSEEIFNKYWSALEVMTYNIFVRNDGSDVSHPELLKEHFPGLDTKTYRVVHRTHFEYMARVVRTFVRDQLRELL
jgi:hypothetical protein